MNSKERTLSAINHETSDRIPLSLGTNGWVRSQLNKYLGTKNHIELLKYLHSDIVDLRDCIAPEYIGPGDYVKFLADGVRENHWGWRTKVMETPRGDEEQFCEFVLKNATYEELEKYNWPSPDWFDFSTFNHKLRPYNEFCVMASGGSVFQHATYLRGMDTFLMDMALQPEIAEYIMDKYTYFYLEFFDKMFSVAKEKIDIFRVADDVAMQTGLLISPEMFDQFVAPRLKKLIDLAHSHNIKFMLHTCGDVTTLIDRFVELGVDILDPIQVAASNMELGPLLRKYKGRLCLHGGVDTQQFLPNATPDQVKEKVKNIIDTTGKSGGYILSTSHVLEGDVPIENILALYDTGYKYKSNIK
jgi:uroporphyrinogen decarboxylase